MTEMFWLDNCSVCHQGRLFVLEDKSNKRLYLHCEECESGWLFPEEIKETKKSFLTFEKTFDVCIPGLERIKKFGWDKYQLKQTVKKEWSHLECSKDL